MLSFSPHIIQGHTSNPFLFFQTKNRTVRKLCTTLACLLLSLLSLQAQFDPFTFPGDTVFTKVEQMPYFTGCELSENNTQIKRECSDVELVRFLSRYLIYPEEAKYNGIEGTVFVSFIVDENGLVLDPLVLKDIGGGCGKAALDVLQEMPRWEPAVHHGRKVKVKMNLPIQFYLRAESRDAAEPYSLSWGTLNGATTTKETLQDNLSRKLYIRGPEGGNRFVDQIEFIFEKDNRQISAFSKGDISADLGKVVDRVKKGGLFTINASVQDGGRFVTVSRSYTVTK